MNVLIIVTVGAAALLLGGWLGLTIERARGTLRRAVAEEAPRDDLTALADVVAEPYAGRHRLEDTEPALFTHEQLFGGSLTGQGRFQVTPVPLTQTLRTDGQ